MANSKSALKRAGQNVIRRARNSHYKSMMRGRIREVREAVAAGDLPKAEELLRAATSILHKVAGKGTIHSKTADRHISRLTHRVNSLRGAATDTEAQS